MSKGDGSIDAKRGDVLNSGPSTMTKAIIAYAIVEVVTLVAFLAGVAAIAWMVL